jgi:hypothetical protein
MEFFMENTELIFGAIIAFLTWLQLRARTELRDKDTKLEEIESKQIKIQVEADTMRSDNAHRDAQQALLASTIEAAFRRDEAYQKEGEKHRETVTQLADSVRHSSNQTTSALNGLTGQLTEFMELYPIQLGQIAKIMQGVEGKVEANTEAVRQHVQTADNQLTDAVQTIISMATKFDTIVRKINEVIGVDLPNQFKDHVAQITDLQQQQDKRHSGRYSEIETQLQELRLMIEDVKNKLLLIIPPSPDPPPPAELFKQRPEEHDESENEDDTEKKDAA